MCAEPGQRPLLASFGSGTRLAGDIAVRSRGTRGGGLAVRCRALDAGVGGVQPPDDRIEAEDLGVHRQAQVQVHRVAVFLDAGPLLHELHQVPAVRLDDLGHAGTWDAQRDEWLPNAADETYIASLMQPVYEPGKMASWIAPPAKGINNLPGDFVYVRV